LIVFIPIPAVPESNGGPVLTIAPEPPTPVPETVTGITPRLLPTISTVALLVTTTPRPPSAVAEPTFTVPPFTTIFVVKPPLAPLIVSVPEPLLINAPAPLMTPSKLADTL